MTHTDALDEETERLTQLALGPSAVCGVYVLARAEGNALLDAWGHYLGGCNRPFGQQQWALLVDAEPVAVATSASSVSATVGGYDRREVVELARLCARPGDSWATRVMLRLWREVLADRWPYWTPRAAVAYSKNDRHDGRIYRFDGWERMNTNAGSSGGGTWSTPRVAGDEAGGRKTLWRFRYAPPISGEAT